MKFDALAADLAAGLRPAYALAGPAAYFRDRAWRQIRARAAGIDPDADCRTLEGAAKKGDPSPVSLGEVLAELATPSLFSKWTVIRIRRAETLVSEHRERLEKYLAAPSRAATLVLDLASLDGRTRLAKKLEASGAVVDCPTLYGAPPPWSNDPPHENDLARWVRSEFARRAKRVRLEDAQVLCSRIGEDMAALENEIEKLVSYVGEVEAISAAAIVELVGANRKTKLFELTEAVFEGREARALELLTTLFEEGAVEASGKVQKSEDTIALFALSALGNELRRTWLAGEWLTSTRGRGDEKELANRLGVRPFAAGRLARSARRLGRERASAMLAVLDETDKKMKSSGVAPESILALSVWRLARIAGQPARGRVS